MRVSLRTSIIGLPPVPLQARVVGVGPQREVYEGCSEAHDNPSRQSGLLYGPGSK